MAVQFSREAGQRIIRGVRSIEGLQTGQHTPPPKNPRRPRGSGGGGTTLFRFTLTSGFTAGTASASIKEMDGTAAGSHDVEDPESIFTELTTDDTGLCLRQGGVYYVIQAPCPAGYV